MIDIQGVKVFLGAAASGVARLDWSRLIPKLVVERYTHAAIGFEFTWRPGPGLGLGLGLLDLWVGWLRPQEPLHHERCPHSGLVERLELTVG